MHSKFELIKLEVDNYLLVLGIGKKVMDLEEISCEWMAWIDPGKDRF
jgi:hypothetical protein